MSIVNNYSDFYRNLRGVKITGRKNLKVRTGGAENWFFREVHWGAEEEFWGSDPVKRE